MKLKEVEFQDTGNMWGKLGVRDFTKPNSVYCEGLSSYNLPQT
jgi:hypothetical protein